MPHWNSELKWRWSFEPINLSFLMGTMIEFAADTELRVQKRLSPPVDPYSTRLVAVSIYAHMDMAQTFKTFKRLLSTVNKATSSRATIAQRVLTPRDFA